MVVQFFDFSNNRQFWIYFLENQNQRTDRFWVFKKNQNERIHQVRIFENPKKTYRFSWKTRQFFLGSLPGSLTLKLVSRWVPGAGTTKILFSSSLPRAGVSKNGNRWLYTYITGLITSKKRMLSQRSTQHWSLTHQTGYPPNTGDGSERTKCRKFGDFGRLPEFNKFSYFDIWWFVNVDLVICEKIWWFVNVENIGAKRTSMLPHGPTNSHFKNKINIWIKVSIKNSDLTK